MSHDVEIGRLFQNTAKPKEADVEEAADRRPPITGDSPRSATSGNDATRPDSHRRRRALQDDVRHEKGAPHIMKSAAQVT